MDFDEKLIQACQDSMTQVDIICKETSTDREIHIFDGKATRRHLHAGKRVLQKCVLKKRKQEMEQHRSYKVRSPRPIAKDVPTLTKAS